MKRIVLIFTAVLVVVLAALFLYNRGDDYSAEKLYYRALKANNRIMENPDVAPPKMVEYVKESLNRVIERYPDTVAASSARMTLAEFYMNRDEYDEAQEALAAILEADKEKRGILSKARFFKGVLYERQGDWESALKEYEILKDEFADTTLGLQMPLYIGRHYLAEEMVEKAAQSFAEARFFYENLSRENEGTVMGYAARTLLTETYMVLEDYEKAGMQLEKILDEYPGDQTYLQVLPKVEIVYMQKISRPEKMRLIYRKVIEKTNSDEIKDILEKKLEELEEVE